MDKQCDFLIQQHGYLMQSITLFDQKAASMIAITLGTLYILSTLHLGKRDEQKESLSNNHWAIRRWPTFFGNSPKLAAFINNSFSWISCLAALCLFVGAIFALLAIYPWAGVVDGSVQSGELALPSKIIATNKGKANQQELFLKDIGDSSKLADSLVALVYSRCQIREWKCYFVSWSVMVSGLGITLTIVSVLAAIVKHQSRRTSTVAGKASNAPIPDSMGSLSVRDSNNMPLSGQPPSGV